MSATKRIDLSIANMREKLAWANRSIARVQEAARERRDQDVQDHFLSYLHASQLIWFYLNEYHKSMGHPNGSGKITWDSWCNAELDASQIMQLNMINKLRTDDVHAKPVRTPNEKLTSVLTMGDAKLTLEGSVLTMDIDTYVVEWGGTKHDIIALMIATHSSLVSFVDRLPTIV